VITRRPRPVGPRGGSRPKRHCTTPSNRKGVMVNRPITTPFCGYTQGPLYNIPNPPPRCKAEIKGSTALPFKASLGA